MSLAPVFSLNDLTKVYGEGASAVTALRGVDLEIAEGELIVLLGPSGSGKSTLLNILGGLDQPSSGQALFRGADIAHFDERALTQFRRRHVGFVFQFYNLIPSLTAFENVELVGEVATNPLPPGEALEMVGLANRMHHFPAQLSGGEQQRVAIARAIAKRPSVLLCDEPTGALDITTGILVLDALTQVNQATGAATLLVTHNADIARLADRVIRFADGRIRALERNTVRAKPSELDW
ncbi:ABC transporter ATP-binding protein [Phenylobacterium sp.]|mgnify:CR=1 FL=1|uniref:ABC transporter ATP-binding protein n=1 Tax=Phenylobacterium sp. TaxID=1871053 RepID=UPI002FDABDDC